MFFHDVLSRQTGPLVGRSCSCSLVVSAAWVCFLLKTLACCILVSCSPSSLSRKESDETNQDKLHYFRAGRGAPLSPFCSLPSSRSEA